MSIRAKISHCIDCGKNGPVIAKRCEYCYKKHRAKVCAAKPANRRKQAVIKINGAFIASQTLHMPANCENCGDRLPATTLWLRKACIAHILPKNEAHGFPSISIHPVNKVFLCPQCHSNYDNLGALFAEKMTCLPQMKERVQILIPFLTERERNKIPDYLL